MIKVTIIALGKLKEKFLRDAADEYIKRLSRFCILEIRELNPVNLPDNPSDKEIALALTKEEQMITKILPENSFKIALCIEGEQLSSTGLAQRVDTISNSGKGITFIIGSSFGLSENIKSRCDMRLSFSKMTFPHQFFRIMLLEQIYRSFNINNGGKYNK